MGLAQKKSVRAAGIVLAVVALAVVALNIFLPTEKIRDLALAQARAQLGREVSVGEVAVSLKGGLGVRLADFAVHNPDGFGGDHLLTAQALDLKLKLGPLFKGEIRVDRLVLDTPVVTMVRQADGRDNFTFVPSEAAVPAENPVEPGAAAAPPPLSVASLNLSDGAFVFSDAAAGDGIRQVQLNGLNLRLSLADPAPGRYHMAGTLSAREIELTGPQAVPAVAGELAFDLTWDAPTTELGIIRLDLNIDDMPVSCRGQLVTGGATPVGAVHLELPELSLNKLKPYLTPESAAKLDFEIDPGRISGVVDLDLQADESLRAKGRLDVADLALAEADLPAVTAVADFDVLWQGAESRLELTTVAATVNGLALTATGHVVTAGDFPVGEVQVLTSELNIVDLAAFMPPELAAKMPDQGDRGTASAVVDLTLTGDETVPLHSSGRVNVQDADLALAQPFLPPDQQGILQGRGDVELNFVDQTGDPTQMTYSGIFTARGVSFTESGLVDELQNLDAEITFTQDKFTVERCQAKFASGSFDLTGSLSDPFPYFLPPEMQGDTVPQTPHLSFALNSPRLDVDRLLPAASPTSADNVDGDSATRRTTSVPAGLEFPGLSCDGTFQADSLIYMQVPLTQVTGKVKLRDRHLSVHEVEGAVYQGRIDGQVDVDLNDLNEPVYRGEYQAHDIEVDNFVTRFAGLAGVVFGGCNLNGGFDARGLDPEAIRNSLTLTADAGIKQGKVVTTGNVHSALNKLASQSGQTLNHEQTLRDLATHISVEDGRVGVSAFKTRLGQFGDVTIDGYYGFDGDLAYTGKVLLTKSQTDQLFSGSDLLRELGQLMGSQRPERLEVPLSVGGTRAKPTVKLDLATVTGDLQNRVVKEQGDKLADQLEDEAKTKLGDLLKKWK